MSKIKDTFFGGAEKKAGKEIREAAEQGQVLVKEATDRARSDAGNLFGAAQQNRIMGAQAGLDILGGTLPQQAQLFQQGNVGAQQVLGQGSEQFQNAILGRPVDRSFMQPQQFQADFSSIPTQLPDFQTAQQALAPPQQAQQPQQQAGGIDPALIAQLLGGKFRGLR